MIHDYATTATDHTSRERATIPLVHTLTSLLGMGPMPLTKIVRCHELVGESRRIALGRPAQEWTNAEDSLRRAAERRADAWIQAEVAKTVEPTVNTIKGLHAEAQVIDHQIAALSRRRYVGPHGQTYTTTEAHERHSQWSGLVEGQEQEGSRKHRRVPPGVKQTLLMLLALDVIVLTFLMAKFLNVDLRRFWLTSDGVIKAITALLFGVLGTIGVALVMKRLGKHHRAYRAEHGGWDFSKGGKATLVAELLLGSLIAVALGTAMAWRFVLDGAADNTFLTAVMAALFALVIGAVAYLSYQSEFTDGSTVTEAIDVLAPQLHATNQTETALRGKREIVLQQAARLLTQLSRDDARIRASATRNVVESAHDKAIRYARSIHQDNGYGGTLPAPRLTLDSLDLALAQASVRTDALEPDPSAETAGEPGLTVAA